MLILIKCKGKIFLNILPNFLNFSGLGSLYLNLFKQKNLVNI